MTALNYAVEQRLRLIDFLLDHYQSLGREEIMDYFGVGPATVTRDFKLYHELAPGNAIFHPVSKRYLKTPSFERIFP